MQLEIVGPGTLERISNVISAIAPRRAVLVTGRKSYQASGAEAPVEKALGDVEVERHVRSSRLLTPEEVRRGASRFEAFGPDLVVAVGGGGVLDLAKLVRFFASNPVGVKSPLSSTQSTVRRPPPLVAIPTTAGSGAEATHFAVLYEGVVKRSIAHEWMLPDVAIVDAQLTTSLGEHDAASAAADALSQAIESYWCIHSTAASRESAQRAMELALVHLPRAITERDLESRAGLAEAAHLAGKAINLTRTTAPHAISYPLTARYGVAHGHAVCLTLGSVLEANAEVTADDVQDPRGVVHVQSVIQDIVRLLGALDPAGARLRIQDLMQQMGLATRLREVGVTSSADIEFVVSHGLTEERAGNNPRRLTEDQVRKILIGIW